MNEPKEVQGATGIQGPGVAGWTGVQVKVADSDGITGWRYLVLPDGKVSIEREFLDGSREKVSGTGWIKTKESDTTVSSV